ncbi:hypothetical protein JCM3770_002384 [Rhodotorula araucariae]
MRSIHNHRRRNAVSPADSNAPPRASPGLPPPLLLPWRICNKYYTAPVAFRIIPSSVDGAEDIRARLTEGDEPAVVVLAPASPTPSRALLVLLARLSSRAPEFEVALLVTHSSTPAEFTTTDGLDLDVEPAAEASSTGIDESAWDNAALAAGFEWVHLPAVSGADSTLAVNTDDGDEADDPLGRIVAALHAHMWEGMERVERPARLTGVEGSSALSLARSPSATTELGESEEEEDGADAWSALGAPPLPAPRVRPEDAGDAALWAFPERFLPSVSRAHAGATASALEAAAAFDNDFAPFVDATSTARAIARGTASIFTNSETISPSSLTAAGASEDLALHDLASESYLYRHPSSAFPESSHSPSLSSHPPGAGGAPDDVELDSLDTLFSRLATAHVATASMGLDERRAYAERVLRELLGDEALDGLSGSEEDEAEGRELVEVGLRPRGVGQVVR